MLRIIVEPQPLPGDWNMAVDEVLLDAAAQQSLGALRIYQWSEPTVSLGYFQPADDPELQGRLQPLPKVRRLSGGGALLHDREVTYSLALPESHPVSAAPAELYTRVHQAILELLAAWGVRAALRGRVEKDNVAFLCFSRGDVRDIVFNGHKLVGSAQRRRRGAVLQHGALLLRRSPTTPEFPGLFDLDPATERPVEHVVQALTEQLAGLFASSGPGRLTSDERRLAEQRRAWFAAWDTPRSPGRSGTRDEPTA